jgi:CMP-N-acetylneuraminic acid synthetase
MNVAIHIPARRGSKRVPRKNFRNLCGKPMLEYALKAAIESEVANEIYLNTDDSDLIEYVRQNHTSVKIYKRNVELTGDKTSSDEFNLDFIKSIEPDILVMINPVCPLIRSKHIKEAFQFFVENTYDTVITASKSQMQHFMNSKPVNIRLDAPLAPSQENTPVLELNWAVSIWKTDEFKLRMEEKGYAVLGTNLGIYEIDKYAGLKISEETDFLAIEAIIKSGFCD